MQNGSLKFKIIFIFAFFFLVLVVPKISWAAIYYVDGNLSSNCTSGNYSIASRMCSGTDGAAYTTVKQAVQNAQAGDTINIRAGTYNEYSIGINFSGAMTTIQAYGSENVSIAKTQNDPIRFAIFALTSSANNITFNNLKFSGVKYKVISGWVNYSGNIWRIPLNYEPTQIRFDAANGAVKNSVSALISERDWYWSVSDNFLYIYSSGNPSVSYINPGINIADNYDAVAIGSTSSNTGYIVINNCEFRSFAHVGVKGSFRWWIKNSYFDDIGTDWNDHHVYSGGRLSPGSEAIIENNYFGYTPGAALHLYSDPSYHIVRNNIINGVGPAGTQTWTRGIGSWGVLLSGDNIQVYNNTIYGNHWGIMFFRAECHDNIIKNNLFYNNDADLAIDSAGGSNLFPKSLISQNNYLGSQKECEGCVDKTSLGGDNYSLLDDSPPNLRNMNSPFLSFQQLTWQDFTLAAGSQAINTGENLGSANSFAFDPSGASWPHPTLDQNTQGSGWEIGAFAYREAVQDVVPPAAPTGIMVN